MLFSLSPAYFLVDMDVPSGYVEFLQTIVPTRPRSELYTALGLAGQGKTLNNTQLNQVLHQIRRHQPDLMVLDVMMPRMDGWSVLEALQELPPVRRPRVVMVTALASPGDRERAEQLGAEAFVPKPFDVSHLVGVCKDSALAS